MVAILMECLRNHGSFINITKKIYQQYRSGNLHSGCTTPMLHSALIDFGMYCFAMKLVLIQLSPPFSDLDLTHLAFMPFLSVPSSHIKTRRPLSYL
jgi:hypothetical protein